MEEGKISLLETELQKFSDEFVIDTSFFSSFENRVLPLLDEHCKIKFNSLVFFDEDINGKYLNFSSQNAIKALLKDQIRYITQPSKTKMDLEINKLLQARMEDFDFELGIAMMITGDNELFPPRTSYYLTKFFKELGFNFVHNSETKRFWVKQKLEELPIDDIYYIITKGIFKRKYFINNNHDIAVDKDITRAKNFFANFLENSIRSNETIDLSDTFNLNIKSELLFNQKIDTSDNILNELIDNARYFFIQGHIQEATEKIWDALERVKTLLNKDKNKGISQICECLSDEIDSNFFNNEYRILTDLGNKYQIRHFEIDKKRIENIETKKYLFFRVLSLINLTLNRVEKTKKDKK